MKLALAVVGCGPRLEVAIGEPPSGVVGLVALAGPTPRSDLVMAAVDILLHAAGARVDELSVVAATRGPGSFTGVRVALATAKGLSLALGVIARGFSSLEVQAARSDASECLAVQPARRGYVYAQPFARVNGRLTAQAETMVKAIASLASSPLPVVAADGLVLPEETLLASVRRSAAEAVLFLLAEERDDVETNLVPVYLEPPPAQLPRRAR